MNPTTAPDATTPPSVPTPPKNDAINPVLAQLKQEAEEEVKRLRAELSEVNHKIADADALEKEIERLSHSPIQTTELKKELPSERQRAKLNATKVQLEAELVQAQQRLEIELTTIRQSEVTAASAGGRLSSANRELTELLEAATRVLPEYADKLDRIVQSALTIWNRRDTKSETRGQAVSYSVGQNLDPLHKMALERLGYELGGLTKPLQQWFNKLSAALQESRLTKVQQMELRLRLTELEMKFQTAQTILAQLGV